MTPPPQQTIDLAGDAFAPLSRAGRLALTLGPPVGFGLILLITALFVSPTAAGFVASMALGTFVGGGKLVILAGAVEHAPVGPWALAALIVYVDLATALMVLGGIHHVYRLPAVGRRIAAARESGWRVLQHNPWMHRVTWFSLAGFVAVPFHGTGALVGAGLGRVLGLPRSGIVTAIGFGSVVGSLTLALAGDHFAGQINAMAERPLLDFVAVVVIAGLMILITHWAFGRSGSTGTRDGAPPP